MTRPDLPTLMLGPAGVAMLAVGWTIGAAAYAERTGLPAVNVAAVALLPLLAVTSLLTSWLLSPRPVPGGRAATPAAAPESAPGEVAPAPSAWSGAGVATAPSRVLDGWPAATSRAAGRHHVRQARQAPARVHAVAYRPGRAVVHGGVS